MFLLTTVRGYMFGGHGLKFSTKEASHFEGMDYSYYSSTGTNERSDMYILISRLVSGCAHRPPPALPIPLLIIVLSEKKSSGRGSWQEFDWVVVLAHTSQIRTATVQQLRALLYEVACGD